MKLWQKNSKVTSTYHYNGASRVGNKFDISTYNIKKNKTKNNGVS